MGPVGEGEGHPLAMCHSAFPLGIARVTQQRHLCSSAALDLLVLAGWCQSDQGSDQLQDWLDLAAVPGPVLGPPGAPYTP